MCDTYGDFILFGRKILLKIQLFTYVAIVESKMIKELASQLADKVFKFECCPPGFKLSLFVSTRAIYFSISFEN